LWLTKILGSVAIITLASNTNTFAVQQFAWDCSIMLNGINDGMSILQWHTTDGVMDKETMKLALTNLGKYCCWYNMLPSDSQWCKDVKDLPIWADSQYLFDHLIDIGFRRLDAIDDPALRYGLPADPKGEEWTKKVIDLGDPDKKISPQDITKAYTSSRPIGNSVTVDFLKNCQPSNDFSSLSLPEKYYATCYMASCQADKIPISTSETSDASIASVTYPLCENIVKDRINTETDYMRQLQVRVGIRNLTNTIQQYTQNYFISTRREDLYAQVTAFSDNLTFVNHKVKEWTPACSGK
jgi:hypothetical protein